MVRPQPYNYERFVQADHLEFSFGGGEANVAVSLANYGLDTVYVTKLPAHAIGQAAVNSLHRYGVDTSMIVRGGDRIGIYYNEKGASARSTARATSPLQDSLLIGLALKRSLSRCASPARRPTTVGAPCCLTLSAMNTISPKNMTCISLTAWVAATASAAV